MPIYEYGCTSCGYEFELLQSIKDSRLTVCPACNQVTLQKKISAAAFHLKGTGWYETDFKNRSDAKKGKEDSESAQKKPEKSDSASDTSQKSKPVKAAESSAAAN